MKVIVLCIILIISCVGLVQGTADKAESAIDAVKKAKSLLETVKDSSIGQAVQKYGPAAALTGAAIIDTVQFIKTLLPGGIKDSKELAFLKEQFTIVNTKLDALDHEFENVKNLLDMRTLKTTLMHYENVIRALEDRFQLFLSAPMTLKAVYEAHFIQAYENDFSDAPLKIYFIISSSGNIFHDNIFKVLQRQLRNNLAQIVAFISHLLRVIHRGLTLQSAYLSMKNDFNYIEHLNRTWSERFTNLAIKGHEVDEDIINAWDRQYRSDCDAFVTKNSHLGNWDMTYRLLAFLSQKFPWRRWHVLTYTFTQNNDKDRYFDNCGGFFKVNVGNKVVIVNSVPASQKSAKINLYTFFSNIHRVLGVWLPKVQIAKRLFEMTTSSCRYYTFRGAFEAKARVASKSTAGFYFARRITVLRWFHKPKVYEIYVFA